MIKIYWKDNFSFQLYFVKIFTLTCTSSKNKYKTATKATTYFSLNWWNDRFIYEPLKTGLQRLQNDDETLRRQSCFLICFWIFSFSQFRVSIYKLNFKIFKTTRFWNGLSSFGVQRPKKQSLNWNHVTALYILRQNRQKVTQIPFNYCEPKTILQFPVKRNYVKTIKIMESSLTSSFKITIPLH